MNYLGHENNVMELFRAIWIKFQLFGLLAAITQIHGFLMPAMYEDYQIIIRCVIKLRIVNWTRLQYS